jgi:hypothetical protein
MLVVPKKYHMSGKCKWAFSNFLRFIAGDGILGNPDVSLAQG